MLKDSFRTPNCIENVNSLIAQLTHNVRTLDQLIPALTRSLCAARRRGRRWRPP